MSARPPRRRQKEHGNESIRPAGHRLSKRTLVGGAVAMVVVPLAATAADAATSDSGTINGCYLQATGSLRVIDPVASGLQGHCLSAETSISWNQVRPQGPQGRQGDNGDPGTPGAAGAKGDKGDQGLPGVSGYQVVPVTNLGAMPAGRWTSRGPAPRARCL